MGAIVCPTCGREVQYESREQVPHRPFCSDRCRWIDLNKWFEEKYCISESLLPSPEPEDRPDAGEPRSGPR